MPTIALWGDSNTGGVATALITKVSSAWTVENRCCGGEPSDLGLVRFQSAVASGHHPTLAIACWGGRDLLEDSGLCLPDSGTTLERDAEWAIHNLGLVQQTADGAGFPLILAEGVGVRVKPHPARGAFPGLDPVKARMACEGYQHIGRVLRDTYGAGAGLRYALCQRWEMWSWDQIHASLYAQDMLAQRVVAACADLGYDLTS